MDMSNFQPSLRAAAEIFERAMRPFMGPFNPPSAGVAKVEAPKSSVIDRSSSGARTVSMTSVEQNGRTEHKEVFEGGGSITHYTHNSHKGVHFHASGVFRLDSDFSILSDNNKGFVTIKTCLPMEVKNFTTYNKEDIEQLINALTRAKDRAFPSKK